MSDGKSEHRLTGPEVVAFIRGQIEADKVDGGHRTVRRQCRDGKECGATIFMVPHPNTKRSRPWNEDGTPHWGTCPAAAQFRRRKK